MTGHVVQTLLGDAAAACVLVIWALPRGAPARVPGLQSVAGARGAPIVQAAFRAPPLRALTPVCLRAALLLSERAGPHLASALVGAAEAARSDYECAAAAAVVAAMMASGAAADAPWPLDRVAAVASARAHAMGPTAEALLARVAIARARL